MESEIIVALVALIAMEVVLGIDNLVFIAILSNRLPVDQRVNARRIGLGLAVVMRFGMLAGASWLLTLTQPWFAVLGVEFSGKDLILLGGGLFLIGKATHEMHDRLEGDEGSSSTRVAASFGAVIGQILLLDIVFSLDSVITAIGMADDVAVMIAAVVVAVVFMFAFSGRISTFVDRHPTMKVLALSFLLLIGVSLVAEGFDTHIPKGYIYFAMAFSLFVETINLRVRRKSEPVHLHTPYVPDPTERT
jgi:predicted tellurium resistance membrane protein TerC